MQVEQISKLFHGLLLLCGKALLFLRFETDEDLYPIKSAIYNSLKAWQLKFLDRASWKIQNITLDSGMFLKRTFLISMFVSGTPNIGCLASSF